MVNLGGWPPYAQEGFGVYKLTDQASMTTAIKSAYQTGYRLFDTAQLYENEALLG